MTDIATVNSAYLGARARIAAWADKFLRDFTRPLTDLQVVMMWDSWPEQTHTALRGANPQAYDKVRERVEAIRGGG